MGGGGPQNWVHGETDHRYPAEIVEKCVYGVSGHAEVGDVGNISDSERRTPISDDGLWNDLFMYP